MSFYYLSSYQIMKKKLGLHQHFSLCLFFYNFMCRSKTQRTHGDQNVISSKTNVGLAHHRVDKAKFTDCKAKLTDFVCPL